jgi:hypothetical protein
MALGEALEMRPMVAQCHDRLGTLYQGLGRPDLAHNHQINAATMVREMDMQLWLAKTPSTAD